MQKSGFVYGLSNEEYHSGPELSSSALKTFYKCPSHFKYEYVDGNKKENSAMDLGSAFHSLILEPDKFNHIYINESEIPVIDKRTKAGKEEWKKIEATLNGRKIISNEDWSKIVQMKTKFFEEKKAVEYLQKSKKEVSAYWDEVIEATGEIVRCRARYDMVTDDGVILDIKTCQDSSFDEFSKSILNYGYFISASYYMRSYERITGKASPGFIFIVCSTRAPFNVYMYQCGDYSLSLGSRIIDKTLGDYQGAMANKEFKKKKQPTIIDIPDFAIKRIETELL